MNVIRHIFVDYQITPKVELEAKGKVINHNMWMPDGGWMYCVLCKDYNYHKPYSTPNMSDCYPVCENCNNHVTTVK